ncbi:5'-3'_deoxyribonucleotidase [Hexamita inflata]|uniref:5'-3' deoxyribonucleotidase n=1 Tax=Hexamita inflata TaxID=28002 RepID=A0AA86TT76_9EUKA|nr:5'-3' deoxyribonucleotidase [Hexamita inflata]CAI9925917.1 5'-3' deoxyribonucleotidase [Hexamita inflata]
MTTINSILFDLDGTLFDYSPTWVPQMNKRYPDINKIIGYPLTEHQLSTRSVLAAQLAQELIYAPRFYVDEQIYDSAYNLVKYLIELGADVWFVTSPVPNYHRKISLISKISQIRRFFGQDISQKIIFSTRKYEVVGKYLIDDQPEHPKEEIKAQWKAILVKCDYNEFVECPRRVSTHNMIEDFQKVTIQDQWDIKQMKQM